MIGLLYWVCILQTPYQEIFFFPSELPVRDIARHYTDVGQKKVAPSLRPNRVKLIDEWRLRLSEWREFFFFFIPLQLSKKENCVIRLTRQSTDFENSLILRLSGR